jgi:hypothetical protein
MGVGRDLQVTQGTGIAPPAVGEDFGAFQLGTGVAGHGQRVAGGLSVTTRREVVAQIEMIRCPGRRGERLSTSWHWQRRRSPHLVL